MRLLAGLGALLGMTAFFLVFALVNGGYVYRVQCPRGGGTTETEWTYRWQSVIPYVGYGRSECRTHTATRVALDAIGLWSINEETSGEGTADHSSEYDPESVDRIVNACVDDGESRAYCECAANEITRRLSPDELERVAQAMRAGDASLDALPDDLDQRTRDANTAAERDCR